MEKLVVTLAGLTFLVNTIITGVPRTTRAADAENVAAAMEQLIQQALVLRFINDVQDTRHGVQSNDLQRYCTAPIGRMCHMPGLAPMCCPVFPEDFLRQARFEVRRKPVSHQSVQRYQLALLLHEAPHVGHEVAGQWVGLSGRQVRRWRQRWAAGDFSVADASGRGRTAHFSPAGPGPGQGRRLRTGGGNQATAEPAVAG
jgi:hypothetical protein